jgi:hypothetical protein
MNQNGGTSLQALRLLVDESLESQGRSKAGVNEHAAALWGGTGLRTVSPEGVRYAIRAQHAGDS